MMPGMLNRSCPLVAVYDEYDPAENVWSTIVQPVDALGAPLQLSPQGRAGAGRAAADVGTFFASWLDTSGKAAKAVAKVLLPTTQLDLGNLRRRGSGQWTFTPSRDGAALGIEPITDTYLTVARQVMTQALAGGRGFAGRVAGSRAVAKQDLVPGLLVTFGRTRGEKTIGEVVKLNPKKVKVRQLEHRRAHPMGTIWNVPYSMVDEYIGPVPTGVVAPPTPRVQPRVPPYSWTDMNPAERGDLLGAARGGASKNLNAMLQEEWDRPIFRDSPAWDKIRRVTIQWSQGQTHGRRSGIRLGSIHMRDLEMRIHPLLRGPDVPDYVVAHTIFHELLHIHVGIQTKKVWSKRYQTYRSQRVIHGPDFRWLERTHPQAADADRWIKTNLSCLLGQG